MSKLKKLTSVILAATLLSSASAFALTANAAQAADTTGVTQVSTADYALQDNVQDGVILHAFNWSYDSIRENLPAIAAAGYTTVQTSPVQQPKNYGNYNDVTGQWWKLYQPVSLSIAEQSWLGTKTELKELCTEADKYGIKIICDIVSNHMANASDSKPNELSEEIKTYEPEMYNNYSKYFRNNTLIASDSSVDKVVQGHVSSCPDLNTNSAEVQNKVISLLKDCIDCGVDGFRFDAAKHIETPDDGSYASDYWKNISNTAGEYYNSKTGDELYIYGEILNTCGSGRSYGSYTKYINVTDNKTGDAVLANVVNGNASNAASSYYYSGASASDLVLWAESHDTYMGNSGSNSLSTTVNVSDENIVKAWAIVAARKDATSLYFARPGSSLMGDASTDTTYKSVAVSEINKFHNLFVGQSEYLGSSGSVAYVRRGNSGVVLSNCSGTSKSVSISNIGMADGTYTDTISGSTFTVSGGTLSGNIGSTGVAVVYNGTTTPRNTNTVESGEFSGETLTLTLGLSNATSGTYCLDDSSPVTYTGTVTIRIGSDYNYGDTVNLTLTATDGTKQTTATYKYVKKESASSGVYIWFNPEKKVSTDKWKAPFNVFIYDEDSSSQYTYNNASWPGQAMQYDEATGYYYVEVSANSCNAEDNSTKKVTDSNFDLAHSSNTRVIFSDSSNVNSAPLQYPATDGLLLEGSSKLFGNSKKNSWEATTLVPNSSDNQDATEVTKGNAPQPSSEPVSDPVTYPTETTVKIDPTSYDTPGVYGDTDLDGIVTIDDVTLIQSYNALKTQLNELALILADADGDGLVDINDATYIQKYLALYKDCGRVGEPYKVLVPTEPETVAVPTTPETTAAPTTAPVTQPVTEPEPEPETYTLYFKTQLTWMTSMGTNLYVYDNNTGESYQLIEDPDEYPQVYTAEVPLTMSSVTFYRALEPVATMSSPSESGPVYNSWGGTVSQTNNCFTLSNDEMGSSAPFVHEDEPEWMLDVFYYDNSYTNWSQVYLYGWGAGIPNDTIPMTRIEGTNIWMAELPEPIYAGTECLLVKDTPGGSDWKNQSPNIKAEEGKNLYIFDGGTGAWSVY